MTYFPGAPNVLPVHRVLYIRRCHGVANTEAKSQRQFEDDLVCVLGSVRSDTDVPLGQRDGRMGKSNSRCKSIQVQYERPSIV